MEGQVKAKTPVATGRLRSSIKYEVIDSDFGTGFPTLVIGSMSASGGSPVVYAAFREFGGTIKAKNNGYLAFAFKAKGFKSPIVTKSGVSGVRARDMIGFTGFGMTGTFTLPSKKNPANKILFAKFKGGGYIPLFVLVKQVKQKGSHYLYPVVERNIPAIGKAIAIAIKKLMEA